MENQATIFRDNKKRTVISKYNSITTEPIIATAEKEIKKNR